VAKAETRWSGSLPAALSWLPREVFLSMAINSGRSGQQARTQAVKQAENRAGLMSRGNHGETSRHMWNGPAGKGFFRRLSNRGRCGHMSGL